MAPLNWESWDTCILSFLLHAFLRVLILTLPGCIQVSMSCASLFEPIWHWQDLIIVVAQSGWGWPLTELKTLLCRNPRLPSLSYPVSSKYVSRSALYCFIPGNTEHIAHNQWPRNQRGHLSYNLEGLHKEKNNIVVWMRLAPMGSYIWIFGSQLKEQFEKDSEVWLWVEGAWGSQILNVLCHS